MITVYKKKAIPNGMELVSLNDVFFNKFTVELLDKKAASYIDIIDKAKMRDQFTIKSKFDGSILNIDRLSTGCKTVLNIVYNPDKIFDIRECGDNALDVVYSLPEGNIYCDYPFISFSMEKVRVYEKKGFFEIDSYELLREWWTDED